MKHYFAVGILLIGSLSCSLFSDLRKREFNYMDGDGSQTLRVVVPKRYAKLETGKDSMGNQQQVYKYGNGAFLYIIQTTDTLTPFYPIDTANNIPLPHPFGGLMYKGLDASNLFWREIRTDSFRIGYRNVPGEVESLFDSAVNYGGMRRFKK